MKMQATVVLVNILYALFCVQSVVGQDAKQYKTEIKIGGIFYKGSPLITTFNLTPLKDLSKTVKLIPIVREIDKGDILKAGHHVCDLAQEGIYGIVDGTDSKTAAHIQAVCDSLELPHIITHHNDLQAKNWSVLNMYPSDITYNRILVDVVKAKEWQNFTILYVRGNSLSRVSALLELFNSKESYTVTVRELSGENYRPVFAAAKKRGNVNFLVDCFANKLPQVLHQAQEVGLMSNAHSYIFTSPDLHTLNLDSFKYGGANITGFRLIDTSRNKEDNSTNNSQENPLTTDMALVHDAVLVYAKAHEKLPVVPEKLSCTEGQAITWKHGSSIVNIIRTNGINEGSWTGQLAFDSSGERNNFTFGIFELTPAEPLNIGKWQDGLKIEKETIIIIENKASESDIVNQTFTVLISLNPPYGYVKETVDELSGNDRYEGFTIDIIDELSEKLGFNYIFEVEEVNGSKNKEGKWNGMVKKIMEKKADLGICDFTITSERQSAIDFTTPFMSVGISILYKKPSKQPPAKFSFMEVFSKEVWINMMLSQMALALVIIFVGRISHKEWHNPIPCVEQPVVLDNQFSIANALWLTIGSVMQQGSEIAPIAVAPRMITSVWWFFTMVMISSYTGTLVAFLTVESKPLPFKNAMDLYKLGYMQYGAKKEGSTLQFFKDSKDDIYKEMYKNMEKGDFAWCTEDPDGNSKGRERVLNGRYAFFMESASIEYETERNCDLMQVGDELDSKNYGIGMIKDWKYRLMLNAAILQMKESGKLQVLKNKWWKERRGGGACTDDKDSEPKQLEMKNMIGAFIVLGAGCLLGIVISILDMLWGVYKRTVKYGTTFRFELIEELRFALTFSGDTKPVRKTARAKFESGEELHKMEERDELESLHTIQSPRTSSSGRTHHSHCSTHRSTRSQSLAKAFARRRRYS